MREDLREAIEAACSIGSSRRRANFATMVARLLEVARDLPEDMTMRELREALEQ